jgi:rhamnose utilization protein RhaD (predicted bifunctional aldolase and dehydrogenase)
MDRNESIYFDDFSKKSIEEIRELFKNLKDIGLSDEQIEKYAVEYKKYFENLEEAKRMLNPSS